MFAGESTRAHNRLLESLVLVDLTGEELQDLTVPQRTTGGTPARKIRECAHLVNEPIAPHLLHTQGDASVHVLSWQGQTDLDDGGHLRVVTTSGHGGGEGTSEFDDLQGPDETTPIAGKNGLGSLGIEATQPIVKSMWTGLDEF